MSSRRADATRNREAILDAAQEVLSLRPQAGLAEVAAASGLTRTTVYAHFAKRDDLLDALVERAIAATVAVLDSADPAQGRAADALRRVVASSWQQVSAFGQLASEGSLPADRVAAAHAPIVERLEALVRRGQADGSFRSDVPAGWLVTTCLALVHAAGREVATGALAADEADRVLGSTVLGAFGVGLTG